MPTLAEKSPEASPTSQILSYSESHYPSPEELLAYEKASPESAQLILNYILKEREAYWQLIAKKAKHQARTSLFGQILAFSTVLILAFAGHSVLENGDVISGIALTGSSFIGLVMAFLQNRFKA